MQHVGQSILIRSPFSLSLVSTTILLWHLGHSAIAHSIDDDLVGVGVGVGIGVGVGSLTFFISLVSSILYASAPFLID